MINRTKPQITEGKCDSCGGDLKIVERWYENGDKTKPAQETVAWEFATVKPFFGYHSRTLDDLHEWLPEIHLCEGCFLKMVLLMKIQLPDHFKDAPDRYLAKLKCDELTSEAQKLGLYDDPKKEKPA